MSVLEENEMTIDQVSEDGPNSLSNYRLLFGESQYEFIFAIIAMLVSLVPIFLICWKWKVRKSVLLMGLSDSGKTLLYSQLIHKKFVPTHTSVKENFGGYSTEHCSFHIVDIPGHERLRTKFFDQYKKAARGIVFVIDSSTLHKDIRDVAEYLYVILTDLMVAAKKPRFLILCNKQDELTAKGSTIICKLLEKELNTLRVTKSSQLDPVGPSGKINAILGKEGKEFEFAFLPYKVQFAESSAGIKDQDQPADISQLEKWLAKL